MTIRPIIQSDAATAKKLLKRLGFGGSSREMGERINRVLMSTGHFAVVVEQEQRIIGLVHAFERPALEKPFEVIVQALVVDKDAQGTGVGRALMSAVEDWAHARGIKSVALYTRHEQLFYEHLGYDVVSAPNFMRKCWAGR